MASDANSRHACPHDHMPLVERMRVRSASGMPEAGYLPIPQKLARAGVKDMVRISEARMSGTVYGTIVLHVAPDAASGGRPCLCAERRSYPAFRSGPSADLLVDDAELGAAAIDRPDRENRTRARLRQNLPT